MSVLIESEQSSPSIADMPDAALAAIVIDGCQQFRHVIPYVVELRNRFKSRPRGKANIEGCQTWEEFCEQKLDRGIRAVQKAMAAYNDTQEPKPPKATAPPTSPEKSAVRELREWTKTECPGVHAVVQPSAYGVDARTATGSIAFDVEFHSVSAEEFKVVVAALQQFRKASDAA